MKKLKKTILHEVGDEVFNNPRQGGLLIRGIFVLIARDGGFTTTEIATELRCSMAAVVDAEIHVRKLLDAGDPTVKTAVAKVRAGLSWHIGEEDAVEASCEVHDGRMFSTIDLVKCQSDAQRLIAVLSAWHLHGDVIMGAGEALACLPASPGDPSVEALVAKLNDIGKAGGESMLTAFRSLYPNAFRVGC